MISQEIKDILIGKEEGYIIQPKYSRFAQVNFKEQNKSVLIFSNTKDFEIQTNDNEITFTYNGECPNYVSIDELQDEGSYVLSSLGEKTMLFISKPFTDKLNLEGLMVTKNRDIAILMLNTGFAEISIAKIKLRIDNSNKYDLVRILSRQNINSLNFEFVTVNNVSEYGNAVTGGGIDVEVVYDIISILEDSLRCTQKENKFVKCENKKIETIEKIKSARQDDMMISDSDLSKLLEDYASTTQDAQFYYRNKRHDDYYTDEEYFDAYEDFCRDIRHNKVNFNYDPRRDIITERVYELDKMK